MKLAFKLAAKVRQAAFAAGREFPSVIEIDVDPASLPETLRARVAPLLFGDGGGTANVFKGELRTADNYTWECGVDPSVGVDGVLAAWADETDARVAQRAALKAENLRQQVENYTRGAERILSGEDTYQSQFDVPTEVLKVMCPEARDRAERASKIIRQRTAEREERQRQADAKLAAERKAAAEAREAEKVAWIAAHGSDHLRAAVAAGYDCQRLYVTERAAAEFPSFEVDFAGRSRWERRSCPSEEGLAVSLATKGSRVVWLTEPARKLDDEDEWEPREAVVVEDFLGRYDLVREVA